MCVCVCVWRLSEVRCGGWKIVGERGIRREWTCLHGLSKLHRWRGGWGSVCMRVIKADCIALQSMSDGDDFWMRHGNYLFLLAKDDITSGKGYCNILAWTILVK